jgi:heme exporter protein C
MASKSPNHQLQFLLGVLLFFCVELIWVYAWFGAPQDSTQGHVYRIIYLHVPAAFVAIGLCSILLLYFSILSLVKRNEIWLNRGMAAVEVGLLFTVITLTSGSIWGKPTWGTYWIWDARLTTTFLLGILYGAYLILYRSMEPGALRVKVCAIVGVLIFVDTPIIYKSVTWWRTLHQPPSMFRPDGMSTIDSEMKALLIGSAIVTAILASWMIWMRARNIQMAQDLENQALLQVERGAR